MPAVNPLSTGERKLRMDLTRSVSRIGWRTKLRRGFWQWLIKPFFLLLPDPASVLRIAILRAMGARIADRCLIKRGVDVLMPWNLEIESCVAIGHDVELYNHAPITIRQMTVVSQYAFLCTGTHDFTHPHFPLVSEPIVIGSECWIATDVFIGPGVQIGDGAVIGARSVVTRDMPEWMVCAGNPCRPLKPRTVREVAE